MTLNPGAAENIRATLHFIEIVLPIFLFVFQVFITIHLLRYIVRLLQNAFEPQPEYVEKAKPKLEHHPDDVHYATFEELFEESK